MSFDCVFDFVAVVTIDVFHLCARCLVKFSASAAIHLSSPTFSNVYHAFYDFSDFLHSRSRADSFVFKLITSRSSGTFSNALLF